MASLVHQFTRVVRDEITLFFAFSWRDWSATLIPASIFAIGAMRGADDTPRHLATKYLFLVAWMTGYIYFFNLLNQVTGFEEDRINKPDRPIPSGRVTLTGAKARLIIVASAFVLLGLSRQALLLPETFTWIVITTFLTCTKAGGHWFGKNCISMTLGTWAMLSAAWRAITPATAAFQGYIVAICTWVCMLTHIQDLRDVKGDAAVGRQTLPLVFGDGVARTIIAFLIPPSLGVLWWGGILQHAPCTLIAAHGLLGYRVLKLRGPTADHQTFMLCTYIFCLYLAAIAGEGLDYRQVLAVAVAEYRASDSLLRHSRMA
ncbi:hypothetical protein HGRIS_013693 [Hohenbuehelia grisea]|uniref:UbiA prenyltransferase n=1 Tax=Hohenbuehelia grisea TaxID=104357 RepID=A0ABR3IWI3_9AGAR